MKKGDAASPQNTREASTGGSWLAPPRVRKNLDVLKPQGKNEKNHRKTRGRCVTIPMKKCQFAPPEVRRKKRRNLPQSATPTGTTKNRELKPGHDENQGTDQNPCKFQ